MSKPKAPNQLVIKRGAVPPAVYLMHVSDKQWEQFIEEACRHRSTAAGKYAQVKLLGSSGDKGRDVEARLQKNLAENEWDLYQAKHYKGRLTPSDAFPELAKFFRHLSIKSYPVPRKYYFCSPHNAGPDLHDLLANPSEFKKTFLEAWRNGVQGLTSEKKNFSSELEQLIQKFDFSKFEECLVYELIQCHEINKAAHFKLFGIEPERGDDPDVPHETQAYELIYITELLKAYEEHAGKVVSVVDALASDTYQDHFVAARETFYAAEGLKRFSRDIYPEEDEFSKLLEMVLKGVRLKISSPLLRSGLDRHDAAINTATNLSVNDSALHPKLRGGDLPGTCHHLVNEKKIKWVR